MDKRNQSEQEGTQETRPPRPYGSVIWTRRNKLLFVVVVVLGALILAQLCFIVLLFASPVLRERLFQGAATGGIVLVGGLSFGTVELLEHLLGRLGRRYPIKGNIQFGDSGRNLGRNAGDGNGTAEQTE